MGPLYHKEEGGERRRKWRWKQEQEQEQAGEKKKEDGFSLCTLLVPPCSPVLNMAQVQHGET